MTIDLSILYGGGSATGGTMSALAMYKKLQQQAAENAEASAETNQSQQVQAQIVEMNNAAIRTLNKQYKQSNALLESDAISFQSLVNSATTVDELVNDDRFLKVIAYANGMEDMYLYDKQRLRDILTSDLNDASSVARQGSAAELELAMKYNLGATGALTDTEGNTVGYDAEGKLVNDGTVVAALPAGLAKIKNLDIDQNGQALLDSDGSLASGNSLAEKAADAYIGALTRSMLREEAVPQAAAAYEFAGEDYDRFVNRTDIQTEIAYFTENIGAVETVDDLFGNQRLLSFILKAYDMESEAQYPGKMRKILESDLSDEDSLANRFQDPRYRQLTEDLNLYAAGVTQLTSQSTIDSIVERFQQTEYEKHLDEQAPGVRVAIEFERRLDSAETTLNLLSDSVLREVVTVANYIPQEMAYQEIDAQIATVERKVDIAELKNDPDNVEKMVLRYLSIKDSENTGGGADSYLLNLFA